MHATAHHEVDSNDCQASAGGREHPVIRLYVPPLCSLGGFLAVFVKEKAGVTGNNQGPGHT